MYLAAMGMRYKWARAALHVETFLIGVLGVYQ
jgi:hypothetical protein